MTKIQATVVGDSLSPQGHRLTSLLCTFPKYLLAEAKTHRIISQDSNEVEIQELDVSFNADKNLSRNSASSRAIPTHRLLEQVNNNPFIPIAWMKEHKGMQGTKYITDSSTLTKLLNNHLGARNAAVEEATKQIELGLSKQVANRYLEPFLWTTVIVSATEWDNFFELRCPQYDTTGLILSAGDGSAFKSKKDCLKLYPQLSGLSELDWLKANKGQAEIHIMALAEAIWDAMNESKPRQLKVGEWHIPFGDKIEHNKLLESATDYDLMHSNETKHRIKVSTAMAARTSYTVVGDEKEISYERLIAIHDRLIDAKPLHASPMEHCARVMSDDEYNQFSRTIPSKAEIWWAELEKGWCRNFRGFIQYRHMIESGSINY